MDDLEYITKDALMMCDQGGAPDFFKPSFNKKVKIHGCLVATNMDGAPLENIPSFKVCKLTQKPCMPTTFPMMWKDTWQVKVNNVKTLIGKSTCPCILGGTIEFMTSGQIPLPADAMAEVIDLQEQADKELNDKGYGDSVGETGFVEGMVPVWGSGRDLINDIQTGDGWGIALNAGFLIWDVASIVAGAVSFGAGTALMQGAKAGVKGATKTTTRILSKKALQLLGKSAYRKLSKNALKKSVDDVAKKLLKTCVFACFPAGTQIRVESGTKNIEDIQAGDLVWAYNEETKEIGLKEVLNTVINETDHTISIYTEEETIETTAHHPFYTNNGWVDASELEIGDKLLTQNGKELIVKNTEFDYKLQKVYNFEVADWHTYFVGVLAWLVHNAGRCLSNLLKLSSEGMLEIAKKHGGIHIINGSLDTVMANAMRYDGFWKKMAVVARDIAGKHLFNNGNKRATQEIIEQMMKKNNIFTGASTKQIRETILEVAKGNLKEIDEIAKLLRGF